MCLNWGCIPTKALLHTADVLREIEGAAALGIDTGPPRIDLGAYRRAFSRRCPTAQSRRNRSAQEEQGAGVQRRCALHRTGSNRRRWCRARGLRCRCNRHCHRRPREVAAGHRARRPNLIWTAREAMVPDALPKRLLVIGAGAIGIEFASFYRTLGSEVTVVEVLPEILPTEDAEIAAAARRAFEKAGIAIHTSTSVASLRRERRASLTAVLKTAERRDRGEVRSRDSRRRRNRQRRAARPRAHAGRGRTRFHPRRRELRDCGTRHLRGRRRCRTAVPRAQGEPRSGRVHRTHRRTRCASTGPQPHPRLHVQSSADRQHRA